MPFKIFFPCKIIGREKIPKGKAILVCNHKSNIDFVYLFDRIWRKQYVLSKESLYKNFVLRWFFRACGGIPVNREKVGLSTIKESMAVLKKDKLLTIFPEGTRNKTDSDFLEFKAGASVFAVKTGAPVVPIFIIKRGKVFRRNIVVIGDPINFDQSFKGEEGTQRANEIIKEKNIKEERSYESEFTSEGRMQV